MYGIAWVYAFIGCVIAARALRICGNYCGPTWCNGEVIDEHKCTAVVEPDPDVYAADTCCMHHDMCCGYGDRHTCNRLLVECIFQAPNRLYGIYHWVQTHLFDRLICGTTNTTTYIIADFFEAMGGMSWLAYNDTMCCGELC